MKRVHFDQVQRAWTRMFELQEYEATSKAHAKIKETESHTC